MKNPKGRRLALKEALLLLVGAIALYFITIPLVKASTLTKRKEIVRQIVDKGLEAEDIDVFANRYFAPNIELEYPPTFNLPPLNTNKASGLETVKKIARAWATDTEHQVDVLNVAADGDTVAVLYNMDRVFIMGEETKTYEDHPGVYFFQFKNDKIAKITAVFDVLPEVEEFKNKKY